MCIRKVNFRPITLTSIVGKLFHKFITLRLCLVNDIIDPSLQKGFLRGINGTMEQIFTLTSIVDHAKSNGLPVNISFLDLKNAFGSVDHIYYRNLQHFQWRLMSGSMLFGILLGVTLRTEYLPVLRKECSID